MTSVYVAAEKERARSWHLGEDYVVQVKKSDWRINRWVGVSRGELSPVPVLLELIDQETDVGGRSLRCFHFAPPV
jgi:hypothetical protein